jgi:hypothetical protein
MIAGVEQLAVISVIDKKGLGQLACPKEWNKYDEGNA